VRLDAGTKFSGIWTKELAGGRTRYYFTVCFRGTRYRRAAVRNNFNSAVAERDRAHDRLTRGLPIDEEPVAGPYTVAQAVADYLAACANLRAIRRYRQHAEFLTAHFRRAQVASLSQAALAGYRRSRGKASGATVNRELSFLRAALNHARAEGKIAEHYFSNLSRPARRKVFAEEPPTAGVRRIPDKVLRRMFRCLREPHRSIARLLLATAARSGEILGLRWGEVRSDAIYLTRTKSGEARTVPLTVEAAALLPRRPARAQDTDLVFPGVADNFGRVWRRARERAKVPWLRVHDLRHEAASRYIEAGGTLTELLALGGWSSLSLVARYSHADAARIRETLERAGGVGRPTPRKVGDQARASITRDAAKA
jgi:integrase